jgi:NADH-quinone oxidoreductase subunit G
VRDERVLRVLARQNPEVDDGWLCDRGRFAYPRLGGEERIREPLLRDGGELRPVSWERALTEAAAALRRSGPRTAALAGGGTTNEEGSLLARMMREVLGSPHLDSRTAGGKLPLDLQRGLSDPSLQAHVSDLEFAHAVLLLDCEPIKDAAILDLRIRKGVRRHGMRLVRATAADLLNETSAHELAKTLRAAGEEIVVLWHERLTAGPEGEQAARALLDLASTLSLSNKENAGLLEIPAEANGRGLREAGVLPNAGPGLSDPADLAPSPAEGLDALGIANALTSGELSALYLLGVDPLEGDQPQWQAALERASTVVAHAMFLSDGIREHANVVFPAEAYAEKKGTIVHPDGRVQRLRPAVGRVGGSESSRAESQVLTDVAAAVAS